MPVHYKKSKFTGVLQKRSSEKFGVRVQKSFRLLKCFSHNIADLHMRPI